MSPETLNLIVNLGTTAFVFALGACVGSFINVVAYRLPLGIPLATPPSRCPNCSTRLGVRENVPILGWLMLRGRCRHCRLPIDPEYPIVEALVAVLFSTVWLLFYVVPNDQTLLGLPIGEIGPRWTENDARVLLPARTWPTLLILFTLIGSLVAMTLMDAKTFTIHLSLTTLPAIVGVVGHTAHAAWVEASLGGLQIDAERASPIYAEQGYWLMESGRWFAGLDMWTLPTHGPFGWAMTMATLAALGGLLVSVLLIRLGLLKRSFADYEQWEAEALASTQEQTPAVQAEPEGAQGQAGDPAAGAETDRASLMLRAVAIAGLLALVAGALLLGPGPAPGHRAVLLTAGAIVMLPVIALLWVWARTRPLAFDAQESPHAAAAPETTADAIQDRTDTLAPSEAMLGGDAHAGGVRSTAAPAQSVVRIEPPQPPAPGGPDDGADTGALPVASAAASAGISVLPADLWVQYPHARREMIREMAFLGPPAILAALAFVLTGPVLEMLAGPAVVLDTHFGPVSRPAIAMPMWLVVLGGSAFGYLIGGLVPWAVRILGSLGFGKEALGIGDVHLMAAVGACVGWVDAVLAFFLGVVLALGTRLVQVALGTALRAPLQFGPALAAGTLTVLLCKPWIERGLSLLMNTRVDLP